MFLTKNHTQTATDTPTGSGFREKDWHILAGFWHPVAFVQDIVDQPLSRTLLDIDLVIFRIDGVITVARNRCPHRGARLSDGVIEKNQLICPMHGLHYDTTGQCTLIPSIAEPRPPIPKEFCLNIYQSVERYGLLWVCLKNDPINPLPEWPDLELPDRECVLLPSDQWAASAGRHVENFNDIAHFPWVHLKSFGGEKTDPFPVYGVDKTDSGLQFEVTYVEGGNRFPDEVEKQDREVRYLYEMTYPFSTLLHVSPVDSDFVHYFADTVCPVSHNQSRIFQLYTDTTGRPDADTWTAEAMIINDEDKPLVEGQSPAELPLDMKHDLSIPADRFSLEYRRGLVKRFGLGVPDDE
jgi:vanillate O-demethylase monooxygenase subunit